jgi:hypothetical protein
VRGRQLAGRCTLLCQAWPGPGPSQQHACGMPRPANAASFMVSRLWLEVEYPHLWGGLIGRPGSLSFYWAPRSRLHCRGQHCAAAARRRGWRVRAGEENKGCEKAVRVHAPGDYYSGQVKQGRPNQSGPPDCASGPREERRGGPRKSAGRPRAGALTRRYPRACQQAFGARGGRVPLPQGAPVHNPGAARRAAPPARSRRRTRGRGR